MILVINANDDALLLPYAEKYKLFTDEAKALAHAQSIGYTDRFNMGVNMKIGMMNTVAYGDVKVSIINLEVQE